MFGLRRIQMKLEDYPDLMANTADEIVEELLNYFEDSNTKPAESVLQLVSKHSLTNKITTNLLNENQILCENGFLTRFTLNELKNIPENDSGLIHICIIMVH